MRFIISLLLYFLLTGCATPVSMPTPTPTVPPPPAPPPPTLPPPTVTPRPLSDPDQGQPPSMFEFDAAAVASAPALSLSTPQVLQLSAGNVAWFRVEMQAGQAYEMFTTDLAEGLDTTITLFWPTGEEAAYNDDTDGLASRIIFVPDVSETLYIRVQALQVPMDAAAGCVLLVRTLTLPPPDAFEPDNTIDQAKPLQLDVIQDRSFTYSGDVDWVRFRTQPGQTYLFRTFDLDDQADTTLSLHDEDGSELAFNDDADGGRASAIVYRSDREETLYLRLVTYTVQQLDLRYRLAVSLFTPAPSDAFEPNDNPNIARPLRVDEEQEHTISDPDDSDWLVFSVRPGTAYRINLSAVGLGVDLEMDLRDAAGNILTTGSYLDSLNRELNYLADVEATVYLNIRAARITSNDTGYRVRLQAASAVAIDKFEPDDEFAQASLLIPGEEQERTIRSELDVDNALVEVQAGEAYLFRAVAINAETELFLYLYDDTENMLLASGMTNVETGLLRYVAETTGSRFLQIQAFNLPVGGLSYRLVLERIPSPRPDPFEPDNDRKNARPIAIGETQQHNFIGFDEDWLMVELQADKSYLIETFDLDPGVETLVEVLNEVGELMASDQHTNLNSRIEFQPAQSGTYYLRILNIGWANFGEGYRVRVMVKS
ncbi:hypothetical protein [Chloroflexus sp. Y-396-1]|uniref:hypothetical protein n=1 Tax=Chloroflexus sp. Y-396-1 TaxID=867845 RepID=UPI00048F8BBD|nr:hypothetical protein [Chloroflexus sp. Y-396-1]